MSQVAPIATLVPGMDLRIWFTGMALIGILASQQRRPPANEVCRFALEVGDTMYDAIEQQRKKKTSRRARRSP